MISDDELLLYHYRELDAAERERIGAALAAEPDLARRLHALVARLDAASATPEVPVPERFQQRWTEALARAGNERAAAPVRPRFSPRRWQAFAAAAAVAAVALVVVFQQATPPAPGQTTVVSAPVAGVSAYEKGLKFHLASTEQQLVALSSASPEERARLVEAIIGQNRIYALAADRAGEPQLARVLRAFTPILEEVAQGGGDVSAENLAQLNFELRVMQARLGADAQAPATL